MSGRSARAGFTLVEVVVGTLILLLAMGALLWAFVQAKRSSTGAAHRLAALQIARAEMERLRAAPYAALSNFGPRALSNTPLGTLGGEVSGTVASSNQFKELAVDVRWMQPGGTGYVRLRQQALLSGTN